MINDTISSQNSFPQAIPCPVPLHSMFQPAAQMPNLDGGGNILFLCDCDREQSTDIYECLVLPFRAMCRPCCAPPASRSGPFTAELWLTAHKGDQQEHNLWLTWLCPSEEFSFIWHQVSDPTMSNIYRILASSYDHLGCNQPFTTWAKIQDELLHQWWEWVDSVKEVRETCILCPRCCQHLLFA